MKFLSFTILFFSFIICTAQEEGVVKGIVKDAQTREALPYVNIIIDGTVKGGTTDENGLFSIANVPLGYVKVKASFVGYSSVISDDYLVTKQKTPFITLEMTENASQLDEVVIKSALFKRSVESPVSLQSLGIAEIEKNPGGGRDILKVIQSLPGVASNPGFRNDIIIRGGSTSENKFYVDGIEVPVINHFQTQGASGGPVGIINTDLIRKVDFYSSAFPANRGNALSSVIEFTQKTGSQESFEGRATLGTSDAGVTLQGPLSENTSIILSARQSYLQFLFEAINLPFLPTYTDFQFNLKSKLSEKGELSVFGLAAIDHFELNTGANDNVTNEETIVRNDYILANAPLQDQWNYTIGASYRYYRENSKQLYVVSRNEWKNTSKKYLGNISTDDNLLYDYNSKEIETKFRFENDMRLSKKTDLNIGFGMKHSVYTNDTYQKIANASGVQEFDFDSRLSLFSYAVFGQLSHKMVDDKLRVSLGLRSDVNTYNDEMLKMLNQLSPRLSASYKLSKKWFLNASVAKYYQLPSYTILGYRDNNNVLVNQDNVSYTGAQHTVAGLEFKPESNSKITLEGFYKKYTNYPFSVENQISLANLGAGFGAIGNEAVISNNEGRAYGFELLAQKKSYNGLYGILSYTFVRSEFEGVDNNYIPSSWDNKHMLTFTGGKKLGKNWEIGAKFRLIGGQPYTPYDIEQSSLITNYDVNSSGILDYSQLNSLRSNLYSQLDVRVDKTWFYKKWSLNLYLDIQNLYNAQAQQQSYLVPTFDDNGNNIIDASGTKYILDEIEGTSGNPLPSIGVIVDF